LDSPEGNNNKKKESQLTSIILRLLLLLQRSTEKDLGAIQNVLYSPPHIRRGAFGQDHHWQQHSIEKKKKSSGRIFTL
jgi:hypothetical protein